MNSPRVQANPQSSLPFGQGAKSGFRTKTAATRLTPEELAEIEAAAESAGQALSEWLRGTALCAARQRPADPAELVLAEVWAVRYALLNLFHAASQAASEGRQLSPDSVLKIRDQADARKLQQARNLLADFFAREDKERARMSAMPFPRSFSLLTPLLWVAAMFLLLLAVRSVLQDQSSREEWDRETIDWGRPRPSLIQRWRIKMGIRFRLPRFSQRQMPEIAPKPAPSVSAKAPVDPLKKATQPMLALFGSTISTPETKPKEAFAWEKTKGIE